MDAAERRGARTILLPLPRTDADPTEVAVPWCALRAAGHTVVLATPTGEAASADPVMLSGVGLGPFGGFLRADARGRHAYAELAGSGALARTARIADLEITRFDGVLLPGGHAPGMREYLECEVLQRLVVDAFTRHKPVGAICHGVLVAARATDPRTGKSPLFGRKTTALPRAMEQTAFALTRAWAGDYYRTYPTTTVEDEVRARLATPDDFDPGPSFPSPRSVLRDRPGKLGRAFTVQSPHYLSARWPGDAHAFADAFVELLTRAP